MNTRLFSMAIFAMLVVTAVSCTTMQEASDGYEDRNTYSRNAMMDDPFFYQNNYGSPVLVRDVRTGRYFYVYPNNYSSYYGSRYDSRYNNDRNRYNDYYRNRDNNNSRRIDPRQVEEQKKRETDNANEARKRILGKQN